MNCSGNVGSLDEYGKRAFREFIQFRIAADTYMLRYFYDSHWVNWHWRRMLSKTVQEWHR